MTFVITFSYVFDNWMLIVGTDPPPLLVKLVTYETALGLDDFYRRNNS